nr:hypothetical protein [Tanacetum cinerariifolium]
FVLIGRCPGALAFGRVLPGAVPRLFPIVGRRIRVPVGAHHQLAAAIAVIERAVFVATRRALVRHRPDAAAEDLGVTVLVDKTRQHLVDGIAV